MYFLGCAQRAALLFYYLDIPTLESYTDDAKKLNGEPALTG